MMSAFLIAEDGPLAGLTICFEEGEEWTLGRDPNVCHQAIEDPMVSRKHAICRLTDEGFFLENISTINPVAVNGKLLDEGALLQEGDEVQVGNVLFRFTLTRPLTSEEEEVQDSPTIYEESDELEGFSFSGGASARWIIKVIAGPNTGAQFELHEGGNFIVGKDPNSCDILFQDLSVSRKHAKIIANEDATVTIEDLGSLNKVLVNGEEISGIYTLTTQDFVALGTTSFLVIDQKETRETIISPVNTFAENRAPEEKKSEEEPPTSLKEEKEEKHWKKLIIPKRHLIFATCFALFLLVGVIGMMSLFKSQTIALPIIDESHEIASALRQFPEVEFSFTSASGTLFVLGHVMTEVDEQEMLYRLRALPFVRFIENNVIIDELVWESTNALLMKNPAWRGIHLTSIIPGRFLLRGYVQTIEDATKLAEYINLHFAYLDKLDNQVVIENTLEAQIQGMLLENQFGNVTFQLSNGELVLGGRIPSNKEGAFSEIIAFFKKMKGVRMVKNFVVLSKPVSDIIDLSGQYTVSGSSKYGKKSQYVVINGKILSVGSELDGRIVTRIENNTILLEKDGVKYKIEYTAS